MSINRWMAIASVLAALAHQSGAAQSNPQDALGAQREAYVSAFNAQDAARMGQLYAPDAVFLPFTGQVVRGAESIAPAMARVAARVKLDLQPVSASLSGPLAYESGTWTHADRESGATVDGGAYLWVWRHEPSGAWVIAAHTVTRKPAAK